VNASTKRIVLTHEESANKRTLTIGVSDVKHASDVLHPLVLAQSAVQSSRLRTLRTLLSARRVDERLRDAFASPRAGAAATRSQLSQSVAVDVDVDARVLRTLADDLSVLCSGLRIAPRVPIAAADVREAPATMTVLSLVVRVAMRLQVTGVTLPLLPASVSTLLLRGVNARVHDARLLLAVLLRAVSSSMVMPVTSRLPTLRALASVRLSVIPSATGFLRGCGRDVTLAITMFIAQPCVCGV
jgi:hypothetical protein